MRVQFERAVLDQPRQFGRDVYAIVDLCDRGQHRWVIDDLDAVLASTWIRESPPWDPLAELAEKTWRAAIDEGASAPRQRLLVVTVAATEGPAASSAPVHATPTRAHQILDRPVYLILENATSDWAFIGAMVRAYAPAELATAVAERWIVPDQAGGSGEFEKRARALIDQGIAPWRIGALMDSDRLAPGPLPVAVAKRSFKLEDLGLTVLVLFKREVENYLPESLLDGKGRSTVRVSFLSLDREQRDHYDMKFGFEREPRTGEALVPESQRALFAKTRTNPWHMTRLVGGFGKNIGDRFSDATLDRDEMEAVCETSPGEIEQILQTLEELL